MFKINKNRTNLSSLNINVSNYNLPPQLNKYFTFANALKLKNK